MRRLAYLLLMAVAATALSSCSPTESKEKVVATTAKIYYDYLLDGRYDDFVAGIDQHIPLSESYREQLCANAKMFVNQQKELHQGISRIEISDAEVDADAHAANAFLVFCYADSTTEQVVVPMVERDGVWLMR